VADVALTIVHAAAHARIRHAGVEYTEKLRSRIEAACVGEEVAFASRLPGGPAGAATDSPREPG
jgi:hypothetical protein